MPLGEIVNAPTLVYGPTGSGKTNLLATFGEYVWETFHKVTRLVTSDLGGFGHKAQVMIRLGIMEVWRIRLHQEAFETCERASQGWWPVGLDPKTGKCAPNAPLVAPVRMLFQLICPACGTVVKESVAQQALGPTRCPTCSQGAKTPKIINFQNGRVEKLEVVSQGFDHVGGICFDGLSSFEDWIMADMASRQGRGELGGENTALGGKIVSGDLILGSNNRAHFGFAQGRAPAWLANSANIPYLVCAPVWTALELLATDDNRGVPIFGPKIAGKAKTDEVPSWVGNCLHTCIMPNDAGDDEWRLYTQTHTNASEGNVPHVAKTRCDPEALPVFYADPAEAKEDAKLRFSVFSLKRFFRDVEAALDAAQSAATTAYPDAPALTGQTFAQPDAGQVVKAQESVAPSPSIPEAPVTSQEPAAVPPAPVMAKAAPVPSAAKPVASVTRPAAVAPRPASPVVRSAVPPPGARPAPRPPVPAAVRPPARPAMSSPPHAKG